LDRRHLCEPFAALDVQTREFMQIEVMKIRQNLKSVVIFVTHSVDEAVLLSDQVVMMRPRPGQIAEIVDVNLPQPRWDYDARATPEFAALRPSTRARCGKAARICVTIFGKASRPWSSTTRSPSSISATGRR
jgi:ABC-type nitrate/sulfonate/bicarbonate transport system ATPase subunit